MKLIKKIKKGFTLVELVVVIAVIAILGAVSVGAYFGVTESAKASKLEQEAREALNNIRLIALSGNENHVLDSNGLHIVDIEIFEKELRKSSGLNYDVISDINEGVSGQTIYLVEKVVSPSSGAPKVYSTLEYLTSEVEGKAGSIDVVNETYNKIDKTFTTTASYSNFEELQAAINKLGTTPTTIKLSGDIHVIDNLEINGKNLTLDLNGYTVTCGYDKGTIHGANTYKETHTILATNGANVIITGNGNVYATDYDTVDDKSIISITVSAYDSNITIKNGYFYSGPLSSTIYSRRSVITIEDGKYINEFKGNQAWVLNINCRDEGLIEDNYDDNFAISGGIFGYNDPFERRPEWKHENEIPVETESWLESGYKCESIGNNLYKVSRA